MNQAHKIVLSSMKMKPLSRQFLSAAIIFFYLIPLLFFASYSIGLMSLNKSWSILSLGLLLITCGSFVLILLIYYWEKGLKGQTSEEPTAHSRQLAFFPNDKETKVTSIDPSLALIRNSPSPIEADAPLKESVKELSLLQAALEENQEQYKSLQEELELKEQAFIKIEEENKQLQVKAQQAAQDFSDYKLFSEEQLKQKNMQIAALQQMIEDQRAEMEKRQDQIYQLDTKVHDLSYEIKTLLYLHEEENSSKASSKPVVKSESPFKITSSSSLTEQPDAPLPSSATIGLLEDNQSEKEKLISSPIEATALLKKCLNIAQKLTGANYHSNEASRYREFSSSHYTIDQRRLFDSLRHETSGLIIMYAPKDNKLLFVNNQCKNIVGWSPEKFTSDFFQIFQEGLIDWKRAVAALSSSSESQSRLLAKTKNGQEVLLNCHLGLIPAGLFRNYIIGIFYPA